MNPTGRNVSSSVSWQGIRAPWVGTKNVWRLLHKLGLFNNLEILNAVQRMKPQEWTPKFAKNLYQKIAKESVYITNIAKCTQKDARHLPNSVYKEYLSLMMAELEWIQPRTVISFGNQVSSVLLQKSIVVSKYKQDDHEILTTPQGLRIKVYPSYYPVGQGSRNLKKAIKRIHDVLRKVASE